MNDKDVAGCLRVLLVEDNAHDRRIFYRAFHKGNVSAKITDCKRAEEALELLRDDANHFDVIVSDHGLPGMSGLNLFSALTSRGSSLPFVLLTGAGNELLAAEALKGGVADYLTKNTGRVFLEQLPTTIARVVQSHRDRIEKQRVEAHWRASEARFRLLVDAVRDYAIFMLDVEGHVTSWNPGAERIKGYKSNEILGKHFSVFYPDDIACSGKPRAELEVAASEGTFQEEGWRIRKDGTRFWASVVLSAVRDDEGKLCGFAKVTRDITERRLAQQRLEHSQAMLSQAQRIAHLGTWDWNLANDEVNWSDEFFRILGLEPDKTKPTFNAVLNRVHVDDRANFERTLKQAIAKGQPTTIDHRIVRGANDIRYICTEMRLETDSRGQPRRLIVTAQDITDRKAQEIKSDFLSEATAMALLAAMEDCETTLEKLARLPVPFFADWCVIDLLNKDDTTGIGAAAHANPNKQSLLDQLRQSRSDGDRAKSIVTEVIKNRRTMWIADIDDPECVASTEGRAPCETVRELNPQSAICVPLLAQDRLLGTLRLVYADSGRRYSESDIAFAVTVGQRFAIAIENARLYDEVRQADKRKDEFLATLAHELRNPLAPIRNALEILRIAKSDSAAARKARLTMQRQIEHMVRLVDDLLDLARIMRGKVTLQKKRVEISEILQRALEACLPLIDARRHELRLGMPDVPIWVNGDEVRLAQVIANLLNNAAKYTDEGGHIWLSCEQNDETVVVRVRDNGMGIDPNMLEHVFGLFEQTRAAIERAQGGLGIGLTLVRRLVNLHGGKVSACSEGLGTGSEFVVTLPICEVDEGSKSELATVAHEGDQPKSFGRRVLIVDDNVDAADMLSELLRIEGHTVFSAHDGEQALEVAAAEQPDVILLDIGLPKLNGYQVAAELRKRAEFSDTLLIAVTGFGQGIDRKRSKSAGFDLHLVKPVAPKVLREVILPAASR